MAVIPDRGVKVTKCFGIFPVFFGKCIALIDNDAYRYAIRLGCGKKTVDKGGRGRRRVDRYDQ